jgi:hypothetical protein
MCAAVAQEKSDGEKMAVVAAFAAALVRPRQAGDGHSFVPVSVDQKFQLGTNWPGIEFFVKLFVLNGSVPATSANFVKATTVALKEQGIERGPSDKGIYRYAPQKDGDQPQKYSPTHPDCSAVYHGRLVNPEDGVDAAHMALCLEGVPAWALRGPSINPANLASKVTEAVGSINLSALPAVIRETKRIPSSSSISAQAVARKNAPVRSIGSIERDENHPRSLEKPVNVTLQQIERGTKAILLNPEMTDILVATADVLACTEIGKRIINTDPSLLSARSKRARRALIGAPILGSLKRNAERIAKGAAGLSPSSPST